MGGGQNYNELMQQAALVNFMLFLNIFKISKINFKRFERTIDLKNFLSYGLFETV